MNRTETVPWGDASDTSFCRTDPHVVRRRCPAMIAGPGCDAQGCPVSQSSHSSNRKLDRGRSTSACRGRHRADRARLCGGFPRMGFAAEPVWLPRQPGVDVPSVRRALDRVGGCGIRRRVAAHQSVMPTGVRRRLWHLGMKVKPRRPGCLPDRAYRCLRPRSGMRGPVRADVRRGVLGATRRDRRRTRHRASCRGRP